VPTEARPLDLLPGVFKEASEYSGQGRYLDGNNVRFWKGFPERIGGNTQIADGRALRPARGVAAWRSISGVQCIAFGHARGVELLQGGTIYNITPDEADGFSTLTLAVGTITSGPYTAGETVTTVAGGSGTVTEEAATTPVMISGDNGTHEIAFTGGSGTYTSGETITGATGSAKVLVSTATSPISVIDVDGTFTGTITGSVSGATSSFSSQTDLWTGTLTGGGSGATSTISGVTESGDIDSGSTTAWGDGTYGTGVWGGTESLYSTVSNATTWTMALWGEDLLACARGGHIYTFDTSAWILDDTVDMEVISGSPDNALGIFMNTDNRTLIAYGAHDGVDDDPVNIRWCDEENNTDWTATSANTAGSLRCENGSEIVGAMSARSGHLISTDTAIYLFRYIGLPFVFSLSQIAEQSAMIGPHCSAELDGITYWMGKDGFYVYDGTVSPLPCDVHQHVFSAVNQVQGHKVNCSAMRAYNEVWWYYTTALEIDKYVCYNTIEKTWHIGDKSRTSQIDTSVVLAYPTGWEADGTINAEELGTTDNGDTIYYTLETSDIEVNDGQIYLHAKKLVPDYNRISGTHTVTIETRGYPQRVERTQGPFNITSATEEISVRARGAMFRFMFAGGDDFRLGRWRYRITGKGRKHG